MTKTEMLVRRIRDNSHFTNAYISANGGTYIHVAVYSPESYSGEFEFRIHLDDSEISFLSTGDGYWESEMSRVVFLMQELRNIVNGYTVVR